MSDQSSGNILLQQGRFSTREDIDRERDESLTYDLNSMIQQDLTKEQTERRRFVIQLATRIVLGAAALLIGYLALGADSAAP